LARAGQAAWAVLAFAAETGSFVALGGQDAGVAALALSQRR
jgi:hypothetical protein